VERAIDTSVLRALAEMTAEGFGGIRRVVSVEDVVRKMMSLEPDAPVPSARNALVALALKDARKRGLCEFGSRMTNENMAYCVTEAGELFLGIAKPKRRGLLRRA
jgi:hypothetical protein